MEVHVIYIFGDFLFMVRNIIFLFLITLCTNAIADNSAFGRNANNLGQGLQIGGGDQDYGSGGTLLNSDGHASWLRVQPSKNESNVELLIYATAAQGRASANIGTSTITRVSGTPFNPSWMGKKFYFGNAIYRVAAVVDSSNITVTNVLGGTIPFATNYTETYHVSYISGSGNCTVSGGVVTRTDGDPFIPFIAAPYEFRLAGTAYPVTSFINISTQTISGAPDGSYIYRFETDINDQITTLRLQKMLGTDEENLSLYARYDGYHLRSQYAGQGQLRPVFLGSSSYTNLAMYPDGITSLGSIIGNEALRILPASGAVNRIEMKAGLAGLTPTLRGRGTDSSVGFGFDTQNAGNTRFTSHSFGNIEFEIFGVGGTSWLAVQSDSYGAPILSANGPASDIDVRLAPKNNGVVWLGKYTAGTVTHTGTIKVKDINGNIREVLVK